MDIFYILNNLYTNKSSKWLVEIEEKDLTENNIEPFLLQRWLCMNDDIRQFTRWLDKYTFNISPKMFISLAWSIIPKQNKSPFITYIKKKTLEDKYDFILPKVIKHLQLSNNDYKALKLRIINEIEKDKVNWFSFYGVPKNNWKMHNLNYEQIKNFEEDNKKPIVMGLGKWGLC